MKQQILLLGRIAVLRRCGLLLPTEYRGFQNIIVAHDLTKKNNLQDLCETTPRILYTSLVSASSYRHPVS